MNASPEISPAPNYWDGETIIIGSWTDEGLPVLLPPADHTAPEAHIAGSLSAIVENLEADLA